MLRPNSQYCEIKDIIYPNNNNNYYSSNIFNKKNNKYLANNPFKITEIQNINNDYDNLIENDNNFNYDKKQRPLSSTNFIHKNYAIVGSKVKNENIENNNNNNFDSMFEKYYQNKLNQKNFKIINNNNNNIETILNQNQQNNNNFKSQFLIENISNEQNNNNNNNNNNISNSNIKNKTILKKNFVLENKKILSEKYKIPSHVKPPKPKENPFHKSYGKTPKYIQNMKIAQEFKKEIENKLKEEKNYPKGTRLLSENERIKTLNGLNESKKELLEQIEKLPISMRTVAVNHKRDELFKKLDEIEDAIKMFERKKVFVKIEKNI